MSKERSFDGQGGKNSLINTEYWGTSLAKKGAALYQFLSCQDLKILESETWDIQAWNLFDVLEALTELNFHAFYYSLF